MKHIILQIVLSCIIGITACAQDHLIGLKSGDTLRVASVELKRPLIGKPHLLANGQDKYELDNVWFYQNTKGHFREFRIDEFTGDRWLKREIAGRITTWSWEQAYYNPQSPGMWNTTRRQYFTKEEGPLQKISYRNLKEPLSDNPSSMQELNRVKALNITTGLGYAIGGLLLTGGIVHTVRMMDTETSGIRLSPLLLVGGVVLIIPLITSDMKNKKIKKAIKVYNQ